MVRAIVTALVFVLFVSGAAIAQETLDPVADGFWKHVPVQTEYGGFTGSFSAGSLTASSTAFRIYRAYNPFAGGLPGYDRQTTETEDTLQSYVLKFLVDGLGEVASAKLILYASAGGNTTGELSSLGLNQAGSTDLSSLIGVWDHVVTTTLNGRVGLTASELNFRMSFDITDLLNADIAAAQANGGSGYSDYIISFGSPGVYGGSTVWTNQGTAGPIGAGRFPRFPTGQPGLAPVIQYTPIPEPGTLALLGAGLLGLAVGYRRRRRSA